MSQTNNCDCACPTLTMLPVRGFGLAVDASSLGGQGIAPGPDNTHLVTRNGVLVWESFGQGDMGLMPPADLYVATDGDDANNGLSPEIPFATIQAAVDSTSKYIRTGQTITIHVAPGTYEENVIVYFNRHYSALAIVGDADNYPVITGGTLSAFLGGLWISYIHVITEGKSAIQACHFSSTHLSDCKATVRNSAEDAAVYAHNSGEIRIAGPMELVATNAGSCVKTHINGIVVIESPSPFIVTGTVGYGTLRGSLGGNINFASNVVISGSVTGRKYHCTTNSAIESSRLAIPGSAAGVTTTGGVFA